MQARPNLSPLPSILTGLALASTMLAQQPVFGVSIISGSQTGPNSVHAADVDGDGDLDALVTSVWDNKVAWYENLGGGSFGPEQIITTSVNRPASVYAADLDGDGDQDVVSASTGDDRIAYYENLGTGTFGALQVIDTVVDPTTVLCVDMDGDGDADVVSAWGNPFNSNNQVAWYENLGNGGFGPAQTITTAVSGAINIHAQDLDGDGDQDILSVSTWDSKVAYYENLGGGSFGPQVVITTNTNSPKSVHAADLDNDGDQDVLFSSWSQPSFIAWSENLGGGSFGVPQTIYTGTSAAIRDVIAADLDGDGDQEVIAAEELGDRVTYFDNLGGGSFGTRQVITYANNAVNVFAADCDNDGDVDIFATSNMDNRVRYCENRTAPAAELLGSGCDGLSLDSNRARLSANWDLQLDGVAPSSPFGVFFFGSGAFEPGIPLTIGTSFGSAQTLTNNANHAVDVHAADLDGDGDLDALSASFGDDKVAWYENLGDGSFGPQQVISTAGNDPLYVYAADLDGDGDQDVLAAMRIDSTIVWYENLGSGSFGPLQVITNQAIGAWCVHATDLDGDGDQDVLSASQSDNKIAWYENLGGGSFGPQQVITTAASSARTVFASDLDGDGDQDVLSASRNDNKIAWYENLGGGSFGPQQAISTTASYPEGVHAADLDGDGDIDVVSASDNLSDPKIAWYENLGGGVFGPQQVISTAATTFNWVYATDLDGDGDVDVLSTSFIDKRVAWAENLGGGNFGPEQEITTNANGVFRALAADFDGDNAPEVLAAAQGANSVLAYKHSSGCTAYSTADIGFFVVPANSGSSTFSVSIPNTPTLIGYQLTAQGTAASSSSAAFLGIAMSNGLRGTVGY
jgi:hypothetical protein